jgi:FAD synthetase
MPGPLTLISDIRPTNLVRKKLVYTERAWRISSHPWTKRLALSFKKPISSTSANISSNPPIYDIKDLIRQFDGKINLIVDDGNLLPCKPSTIFDTRMCSILRPGPITKKAIENVIHKKVREGKLRVLAGGCFNAIHKGHIYFLREAKKLGDELIVVIANDAHNNKPYAVKATIRKKSLDSLGIANKAVIGEKDGFIGTVLKERPDVIALGYNQELPPDVIEKFSNLKVVRIKKFGHYSTSKMARRNLISAKD